MDKTDEILISAEHVSKKFCLSLRRSLWYGIKDMSSAINPWKSKGDESGPTVESLRKEEFWAIKDVSFEVRRGECLGLIGHNGAGKSTLLKMLYGLNRPDRGRITMRGRVCALIELGAGFNGILTGRENIYNQAALLGFSKRETDANFDAIVDFSELEEFLDTPVQNYSSGMKVKLGFAVASQMEPDILLIDEVLAVGDVGFRYKCLNRILELQQTCAFIFVSHSMPAIARICTDVMHLDYGKIVIQTKAIDEGIKSYYSQFSMGEEREMSDGQVEIVRTTVLSPESSDTFATVHYQESLEVEFLCRFAEGCESATIQMVIWNQEMFPVADVLSDGMKRFEINPGPNRECLVRARIPDCELNSGSYSVSIIILSCDGSVTHVRRDRGLVLQVVSNSSSACAITTTAEWSNESL